MTMPALLTPEQFAEQTNLGRTTVFTLIATDEVRSVKIGRLRRIPATEVDRFVSRLLAQARPPAEPPAPADVELPDLEKRLRTVMNLLANATAAATGQACWTPPYWHRERDPVVASLAEATRLLALVLGEVDQTAFPEELK